MNGYPTILPPCFFHSAIIFLSLSLTHFLSFCYPCTHIHSFFHQHHGAQLYFHILCSNWPYGWTLATRVFECFSVCVFALSDVQQTSIQDACLSVYCFTYSSQLGEVYTLPKRVCNWGKNDSSMQTPWRLLKIIKVIKQEVINCLKK